MICVLYNNTQKNARKNTKKDRKNPKKYIISMNNAFNNLCEVSNSRESSEPEEVREPSKPETGREPGED